MDFQPRSSCSAQLLCRCVSVENKFVETDRFFQEPETATFALLLPPPFYPFLARKFVHERRRRALVSSPESAFRFLPRRLESFIFVSVATKFALGSLDPIVQPRQKIGFCDPSPATPEDDFPNGEFGNPLVLRALNHAARARDPAGVRVPSGPFVDILRAWHGHLAYDPALVRAPVAMIRGEWDGLLPDEDARWLFDAFTASPIRRDIKIGRATHLMHLEVMRTALWISGKCPSANCTSTTGPMTSTTRPVFRSFDAMMAPEFSQFCPLGPLTSLPMMLR